MVDFSASLKEIKALEALVNEKQLSSKQEANEYVELIPDSLQNDAVEATQRNVEFFRCLNERSMELRLQLRDFQLHKNDMLNCGENSEQISNFLPNAVSLLERLDSVKTSLEQVKKMPQHLESLIQNYDDFVGQTFKQKSLFQKLKQQLMFAF